MRWTPLGTRFLSVTAVSAVAAVLAAGAMSPPQVATAAPSVHVAPPKDGMNPRPRVKHFAAASTAPLVFHGGNAGIGVTTGAPKVYLVFWGSQWGSSSTGGDGNLHLTGDAQGVAPQLQSFFKGVGRNNEQWSGVVTQYCEGVASGSTTCPANAAHVGVPTSGAYAGVWADTASAAPSRATQGQLGAEAVAAAAHFSNLTADSNRNAQYVVVSPSGTHPDGFNAGAGFCAWHSYVPAGGGGSPYGPLAFTNLPYIPDMGWSCGAGYVNGGSGALDGVTIVEGHEYAETVTDQTLGAWWDGSGQENADRCAWNGVGGTGGAQNVNFGTGSFPVQASWSNDGAACRIAHAIVGSTPTGNFSISASSVSAIRQGASATSTIRTTVSQGSSLPVTLSTSSLPAGITASFATNPLASGSSTTLTLSTTGNVAPGRYSIVVTGTATSGTATITHSVTVTLTVNIGRDYSLSGGSVSVRQGATGTVGVTTRATTADLASIGLSTSALPDGVQAAWDSNPVTAGTRANLTLTVDASAAPGRYRITVTGNASSGPATVTHTAAVTLTITLGNEFALTGASVTLHRGATGNVSISTRALFGSPTISLGVVAPPGVGASIDASVAAGTRATLTVSADPAATLGRYAVTITGTASSGPATVTHSVVVYVTVVA